MKIVNRFKEKYKHWQVARITANRLSHGKYFKDRAPVVADTVCLCLVLGMFMYLAYNLTQPSRIVAPDVTVMLLGIGLMAFFGYGIYFDLRWNREHTRK